MNINKLFGYILSHSSTNTTSNNQRNILHNCSPLYIQICSFCMKFLSNAFWSRKFSNKICHSKSSNWLHTQHMSLHWVHPIFYRNFNAFRNSLFYISTLVNTAQKSSIESNIFNWIIFNSSTLMSFFIRHSSFSLILYMWLTVKRVHLSFKTIFNFLILCWFSGDGRAFFLVLLLFYILLSADGF